MEKENKTPVCYIQIKYLTKKQLKTFDKIVRKKINFLIEKEVLKDARKKDLRVYYFSRTLSIDYNGLLKGHFVKPIKLNFNQFVKKYK